MKLPVQLIEGFDDIQLNFEAIEGQDAWTAPVLLHSWANAGSTSKAGYLTDGLGFVHLRGRITGGASGSVAFTLPPGYRPGNTADSWPGAGNTAATGSFCLIQIVNGQVTIYYPSGTTDVGLAGITFLAEN